jgi:hypothetical protein
MVAFLDLVVGVVELVYPNSRYRRFWFWVGMVAPVTGLLIVWTK